MASLRQRDKDVTGADRIHGQGSASVGEHSPTRIGGNRVVFEDSDPGSCHFIITTMPISARMDCAEQLKRLNSAMSWLMLWFGSRNSGGPARITLPRSS